MDQGQQAPRRLLAAARGWWARLRASGAKARARHQAAHRIYCALVDQARAPVFFRDLGVPDSPEGRFEMIGLHVALALRRLAAEGSEGQALGQELFDLMFADMDSGLRELGVGDLSVGKHVKRLARNLLARLRALEAALSAGDVAHLERMLRVNIYHGGGEPRADQVEALERYLVELDRLLAAQDGAALLRGEIDLALPERPSDERLC